VRGEPRLGAGRDGAPRAEPGAQSAGRSVTGRQDVKSVIIHADGRRTDLAGMVDSATYAELENLRCPRHSPVLWCGGCGGSIYVRHGATRKDELFGAHHDRGDCTETLVIRKSLLSDEHKCQAEYHALAAQDAGHTADLEVTTTGHTRVDVVINGTVGIEVQRSALTKAAAVDRTARSVTAGLSSVTWFTDRGIAPQWTGHVPGYRAGTIPDGWKTVPPRGTATAAGLQIIEAVRCGTRSPCWHPRPCTRFIPWLAAWNGLRIDDVVEGLATETIRPVRYGKYVRLLSASSIDLHEELTGIRLTYDAGHPKGRQLPPSLRQECERLLPVLSPSDAAPAVREWFDREAQRVQRHHEELEQREWEEQQRQERERREAHERHARAEREHERAERGREARAQAYAEMMRKAREQQEALTRQAEQARENCLRYDREIRRRPRQPAHCDVPGCTAPGRLYPAGFRCDQHKPRPYLSTQLGDGTN